MANEKEKQQNRDRRRERIVRDLAKQIEQRGRERYEVKARNIRARMMDVMKSGWPNSSDVTLAELAVKILLQEPPDEDAIFAEVRELNAAIIPSECPAPPYPGE